MTIQEALARSHDFSNWLDRSIDGLDIPSGDREVMAMALLDQVHEHHKAIQMLLKISFAGSAFSLLRMPFETFVRGAWLLHCASDEDVKNFTQDKINKSFEKLIKDIETHDGHGAGVLSKVKKEAWGPMCSYAHGGYLQVVRRITPDHITPNYSDDEKLEVINSSNFFAMLSAYEIFSLARRNDLNAELLDRMRAMSFAYS